jgi:large subunit ribosomal protein L7A
MIERLVGKKVTGIKQSTKSLKNGLGKTLYVAEDAEEQLTRTVIDLASLMGVEIVYIKTMKDLGRLCGIDVGAAVTLLLKE